MIGSSQSPFRGRYGLLGSRYKDPSKEMAPAPSNMGLAHGSPTLGSFFNISKLPKTDVFALGLAEREPLWNGAVSAENVAMEHFSKVGLIYDFHEKKPVGTSALVRRDLLLAPRHTLQEVDLKSLIVKLGCHQDASRAKYVEQVSLDHIVEESVEFDYVLVRIKGEVSISPLDFSSSQIVAPTLLLHYPGSPFLKASIHLIDTSDFVSHYLRSYHDTDHYSSGGVHLNAEGKFVAMHLGSQFEGDRCAVSRYALEFQTIVQNAPDSFLARLIRGETKISYLPQNALTFADSNFLMEEEGYASEKILRDLLGPTLETDSKIKKTKQGKIYFKDANNLGYIQKTYPKIFQQFIKECTGKTGLHRFTKQYAVQGLIESDHLLPHEVWKLTKNKKMQGIYNQGSGKRPGENEMPAITISYSKHRILFTTGSEKCNREFRQKLVRLCDRGEVDQAILLCLKDYESKGISLQKQKGKITHLVQEYVKVGLITQVQKEAILKALMLS